MKERIEKMKKTELLKKLNLELFDKHQLEEIFKGLKENLDISWYAKPEFDFVQMEEIRKIKLMYQFMLKNVIAIGK